MFLEGSSYDQKYQFRFSGALSDSRWMNKVLYSIFIVKLYVKAWFSAGLAMPAPINDFEFFKALIDYGSVKRTISETIAKKFALRHWYLN